MNEMVKMLNQTMCLPFTAFASGMEMMARGMEGSWGRAWNPQGWTERWWDGGGSCCREERSSCSTPCDDHGHDRCDDRHEVRCDDRHDDRGERDWDSCGSCGRRRGDCTCHHDRRCGDSVRLVEWSLVSVARHPHRHRDGGEEKEERDFRRPLDDGEWVVSDCVSDEELRNEIIVNWARKNPGARAKNLRVSLRVRACWRRNDWDYEDEQIDALHEIRDAILDKRAS